MPLLFSCPHIAIPPHHSALLRLHLPPSATSTPSSAPTLPQLPPTNTRSCSTPSHDGHPSSSCTNTRRRSCRPVLRIPRLLVIRPPITPQLHQPVLPSPPPQPSNRCILLHPALTVAPGSGIDARVDCLIWCGCTGSSSLP